MEPIGFMHGKLTRNNLLVMAIGKKIWDVTKRLPHGFIDLEKSIGEGLKSGSVEGLGEERRSYCPYSSN